MSEVKVGKSPEISNLDTPKDFPYNFLLFVKVPKLLYNRQYQQLNFLKFFRMEESNHTTSTISRSNSRTSSNSELEREIADLDINALKNSSTKKRISSSRTPTRKAKRVRFYRNGDRFYSGIVIAVSNERYRWVKKIKTLRKYGAIYSSIVFFLFTLW